MPHSCVLLLLLLLCSCVCAHTTRCRSWINKQCLPLLSLSFTRQGKEENRVVVVVVFVCRKERRRRKKKKLHIGRRAAAHRRPKGNNSSSQHYIHSPDSSKMAALFFSRTPDLLYKIYTTSQGGADGCSLSVFDRSPFHCLSHVIHPHPRSFPMQLLLLPTYQELSFIMCFAELLFL